MAASINDTARRLFAPLAPGYERWASILSLGQDRRWRAAMVAGLGLPPGGRVLDVAAGTGSISRLLAACGHRVVALDQSWEMLTHHRGGQAVEGQAEHLPFPDGAFDAVTFGYLLRYVDDPEECLRELARVVRPSGVLGMVEFGRPSGGWGLLWLVYTRLVLPAAALLIGSGWGEVGSFLGPSIDDFHRRYPGDALRWCWEAAGLLEVRTARPSLGGGLLMWGRRP